jgi:hypothetical protein
MKMFPYELIPHYVKYQLDRQIDALRDRWTVRDAHRWIR